MAFYNSSESDNVFTSERPLHNIVTIAKALQNKHLTKTIFHNGNVIQYDNVKYFSFYNYEITDLQDLFGLVKYLLHRPRCCILRGIAKDDSIKMQRRLYNGNDATIIEQGSNWFALDIDGFDKSSGNLRKDTLKVLKACNLRDVECFSIPSSSYMIKDEIRIRLFFWNDYKISCLGLKKHFQAMGLSKIIDLALFHPIQPIYVARPNFVGLNDPCDSANALFCWITGKSQTTSIYSMNDLGGVAPGGGNRLEELKYTVAQAKRFKHKTLSELANVGSGQRHTALFRAAIFLAKLCAQNLLDEDETKEELETTAFMFWRGNMSNDRKTINDGFLRGYQAMNTNT